MPRRPPSLGMSRWRVRPQARQSGLLQQRPPATAQGGQGRSLGWGGVGSLARRGQPHWQALVQGHGGGRSRTGELGWRHLGCERGLGHPSDAAQGCGRGLQRARTGAMAGSTGNATRGSVTADSGGVTEAAAMRSRSAAKSRNRCGGRRGCDRRGATGGTASTATGLGLGVQQLGGQGQRPSLSAAGGAIVRGMHQRRFWDAADALLLGF